MRRKSWLKNKEKKKDMRNYQPINWNKGYKKKGKELKSLRKIQRSGQSLKNNYLNIIDSIMFKIMMKF